MSSDTYAYFASPSDVRAGVELVDLLSAAHDDLGARLFEATRGTTAALALMLSNAVVSLANLDPNLTTGMVLRALEDAATDVLRQSGTNGGVA